MIEIIILVIVLFAGLTIGGMIRRRAGRVRSTAPLDGASPRSELLAAAGVVEGRPAVVHFSATWCGPCVAVRRVVAGVAVDLAETPQPPLDVEVDMDTQPALARELNVLSLPTTFVFDAEGHERFRISGVPKTGDLRSALVPLTVPNPASSRGFPTPGAIPPPGRVSSSVCNPTES